MPEPDIIHVEYHPPAPEVAMLVFPEPVRMRPGMYVGDVGVRGLHHLFREIFGNAVDEAMRIDATRIDATLNADNSLSVRDNGRGIPAHTIGDSGKSAPEYVFTELHFGETVHGDDEGRLRRGGIGASAVNALSAWLRCETRTGGMVREIGFERGLVTSPLQTVGTCDPADTGITITWLADAEMFAPALDECGELAYNPDHLRRLLREKSYFVPGATFTFADKRSDTSVETFHAPGGVADFVADLLRDRVARYPAAPIALSGAVGGIRVEVALQHAPGDVQEGGNICGYVNGEWTPNDGTHITGFRRALTRATNTATGERYEGSRVREGLTAVVAVFLPRPGWCGSDKTRLGTPEAEGAVFSVVYAGLRRHFAAHPDDATAFQYR